MTSDSSSTGHWTIYVCGDCGQVYGYCESCHSPLHGIKDPSPVEVVAVDALVSDAAIEAMVLAAASPVHDVGHTDTYYRGLMQAAINATSRKEAS